MWQVLIALTFRFVANPGKMKRLRDELRTIMPILDAPVPALR